MPEIMPDLSEVQSNTIPVGTYEARIKSATPDVAKSSGNPVLKTEFEVYVGGNAVPRTMSIPTSGKGAFRFLQLLRATGFTEIANQMSKGDKVAFNSDDLEGQTLTVTVEHEEYQGEMQDRIQKFVRSA